MEKVILSIADRPIDSERVYSSLRAYFELSYQNKNHSISVYQSHQLNQLKSLIGSKIIYPKVILLKGNAFVGKSEICKAFVQFLFETLEHSDESINYIPIYISLSLEQSDPQQCIKDHLKKCGISDEDEITRIKNALKFVLILDDYDAQGDIRYLQKMDLFDGEWPVEKVIITSREVFLAVNGKRSVYRSYLIPKNEGKINLEMLEEIDVEKLEEREVMEVIEGVLKAQGLRESRWRTEDYQRYVEEVPGLKSLLRNPYLLESFVIGIEEKITNPNEEAKKDIVLIYEYLVERWYRAQARRTVMSGNISQREEELYEIDWEYGESLACQLIDGEVPIERMKLGSKWKAFLNSSEERVRIAMNNCMLKVIGEEEIGFESVYVQGYLRRVGERKRREGNKRRESLFHGNREDKYTGDEKEIVFRKKLKLSDLNQKIIVGNKVRIQLEVDNIREDGRLSFLKSLVELSKGKDGKDFAIGATNAITILNAAQIIFSRWDLKGVILNANDSITGKHVGAELSGGYFDQADLSNADLSHVQIINVWLREASLAGCNGAGINFGIFPWFKQNDQMNWFDYREDLQHLVSACGEDVMIWNMVTGEQLSRLQGHTKVINCVQFSPNGKWVVSGSFDMTVRIWMVESGAELAVLQGHENFVNSVAFSPDGEWVVSGSFDKTVQIWGVVERKQKAIFRGHDRDVTSVQFSPKGEWVVSGSRDCTIRLWDIESGTELAVLREHTRDVNSVQFSLDGKWLVSGSTDKTVRIWDVTLRKSIAELVGHEDDVVSVAFSPEGERVVSGSLDKTVRIWDVASKMMLAVLRGHEREVTSVQFSLDGKRVMSGSYDRTMRVWDVYNERSIARSRGHKKEVISVRISPDGGWVVSGSWDKTVRIWDRASGQELSVLRGHESWVCTVAFSPDGQKVVSGSDDTTLQIWEVENRKQPASLQGHTNMVKSVVFSLDGKRVVSGCWDGTVRIWDVVSGRELTVLQVDIDIRSLVFSPDEGMIAMGGFNDVQVIEVASSQTIKLAVKEIYERDVNSVQFSPNGKHVMAGSEMTVQMWEIASAQSIGVLKFHDIVVDFSHHCNGSLVIGFKDHSIECWQNIGDEDNYRWQLRWSTNIDSPTLFVEGLQASSVIGMSPQNRLLLEQHGAIVAPKAELITHVAKRSGSPLHLSPREAQDEKESCFSVE